LRCGGVELASQPLIGEPGVELTDGGRGQVGQQLREVNLWVDSMAAAGTGEAGEDGGGLAASLVPDE
jgi:hypothetical protein